MSDPEGVYFADKDLELGSASSSDGEEMKDTHANGEDELDDLAETTDEADDSAGSHKGPSGYGSEAIALADGSGKPRFIPVTLCFNNLFYSVKVRKGKNPFEKKVKRTLLKDIHGEMRPGEVTAIMGPSGTYHGLLPGCLIKFTERMTARKRMTGKIINSSLAGAGKTTLLNLLAGRVQSGKAKGSITVNGTPKKDISKRVWNRLCSYIMQVRSYRFDKVLTSIELIPRSRIGRSHACYAHPSRDPVVRCSAQVAAHGAQKAGQGRTADRRGAYQLR